MYNTCLFHLLLLLSFNLATHTPTSNQSPTNSCLISQHHWPRSKQLLYYHFSHWSILSAVDECLRGQNVPCNHIDIYSARYMLKIYFPVMSLYSNILYHVLIFAGSIFGLDALTTLYSWQYNHTSLCTYCNFSLSNCVPMVNVVYIFGGVHTLNECDMQASSHDLCTIL